MVPPRRRSDPSSPPPIRPPLTAGFRSQRRTIVVGVVGNCQGESIAFLLQEILPDIEVLCFDVADPEAALKDPGLDAFVEALARTDGIFVQPNRAGPLSHVALKAAYPEKTFVIGNFYFRGLHPDLCYVGAVADRFQEPSLYHSLIVLDSFRRGLSEKKACRRFCDEGFAELGLWDAWETSLDELRRRDEALDFPIADLVETYCHERQGFLTINHPTLGLLTHYIGAVLREMGYALTLMNIGAIEDPLTRHDVPPVWDAVAEHNGLPYRTTQKWMIFRWGRRFLDLPTYVEKCYAAYRTAPQNRLKVHSPLDMLLAYERHVPTLRFPFWSRKES